MSEYKYCPYCGHKYRDCGEKYCGGCGKPVNESPTVKGLIKERVDEFFSWEHWEDSFLLSVCLPVIIILLFAVALSTFICMAEEHHDKNTFVQNETIIGKYMDNDSWKFIVTKEGQYRVSARTYYLYNVNDTFNGSWNELEIQRQGTILKEGY